MRWKASLNRIWIIVLIVLIVGCAEVFVAYQTGDPVIKDLAFALLAFIPIAFALQFAKLLWLGKFEKHPAVFAERNCEFDDREFRLNIGDEVSNKVSWKHFTKAREFGDFYLLYLGRLQGVYIPQSAFHSPGDESKFREVLAQHGLLKE